jgi:hypothetical protein
MMFLDCPAYLDQDGAQRCGLPAEVCDRFTARSTGGPVESVRIRCPSEHWFSGPVEFLTCHADPAIEQVEPHDGRPQGVAEQSCLRAERVVDRRNRDACLPGRRTSHRDAPTVGRAP